MTVKGLSFRPTEKIRELEVFPVRVNVEADMLLPPEYGIPRQSLITGLHSPAKAWAGLLRGNPNQLKAEDGQAILDAIQKAKQTPVSGPPSAYLVHRRRQNRRHPTIANPTAASAMLDGSGAGSVTEGSAM